MLEYILAISVLINFVLIIACVILKRSKDWHEQMWLKIANARNRERMMKYHGKSQN
jgi:hypothetical protein